MHSNLSTVLHQAHNMFRERNIADTSTNANIISPPSLSLVSAIGRRYKAEILPTRRETLSNQTILAIATQLDYTVYQYPACVFSYTILIWWSCSLLYIQSQFVFKLFITQFLTITTLHPIWANQSCQGCVLTKLH